MKGITNGALVSSYLCPRLYRSQGMCDEEVETLYIDGRTIHEVGIPWHWGWAGMFPGATANFLTPFIGDANTRIPETKVFMVDIALAP